MPKKHLLAEVEDNIEDLTKAIQVSVEKLTSGEEKNRKVKRTNYEL